MGSDGIPKSVVRDSAASRKEEVSTALSLLPSTGTSTNDFLRPSKKFLFGVVILKSD